MQTKVAKFGGTSLADARQFQKVAQIIKADPARRFIVPSAPGKRSEGDIKVTDMLYACYDAASRGGDIRGQWAAIEERFDSIISGLGLKMDLRSEYDRIVSAFRDRSGRDYAASRGEYLGGLILAEYLGVPFIDAADVIFFDEHGAYDEGRTRSAFDKRVPKGSCAVIPGFYGSMPNDTIRTFSRNGSDITGSIVAACVGADVYENWTNVSGFMMADPRVVDDPKVIEVITYRELRELSYMGAQVLHEEAIFPVQAQNIPINVRNTDAPDAMGTMIVGNPADARKFSPDLPESGVVTGISGKKGFGIITVEKAMMNAEYGFARRILSVLERNRLSFEHMPSGIDTLCCVLNERDFEPYRERIFEEIMLDCQPDTLEYNGGLALLAIVGRNMRNSKGTAARVFRAIAKADVNIRMIDQGSSELNIIVGVNDEDYETALRAIYEEFAG